MATAPTSSGGTGPGTPLPEISPLTCDDAESAAELWRACGLTRPWNDPLADFLRAVDGPASQVLGVRDEDGRAVASVMVGHDGHRGWLYYVAVDETLRGRGLGRALVGAAEAWLVARGIPKVMLLVRADNTGVLAYYEGQGFERSDTVLMQKWLDGRSPVHAPAPAPIPAPASGPAPAP